MECKRSSWGKQNKLLLPILRISFCPKEAEVMYMNEMKRDPWLWTFPEEWNGQLLLSIWSSKEGNWQKVSELVKTMQDCFHHI